ncbi:hypothetical protein PENVUL_c018G03905 [Penicillium vulpinum]|uniref:NAD-dependent epimerase/dehydratase domain-containing protein n=1 Tax=Penicillium vulpinum TaxID=29845 RepID=A0A1V6RY43_9EURO|nr:hypothetical protein PENVUL_c018G03905 [Penicillium vulpinum]
MAKQLYYLPQGSRILVTGANGYIGSNVVHSLLELGFKTEGEKEAWSWMEKNKPDFQFNTVLPNFTIERILHEEIHGSTMGWVRGITTGNPSAFGLFAPQYFCDVIDIARLHAAALLDPNTVSRRLFGFAAPINLTDMILAVQKLQPDNILIPEPPVDEGRDLSEVIPAKEAERLLREFCGREGWTSLEEIIAQGIEGC